MLSIYTETGNSLYDNYNTSESIFNETTRRYKKIIHAI